MKRARLRKFRGEVRNVYIRFILKNRIFFTFKNLKKKLNSNYRSNSHSKMDRKKNTRTNLDKMSVFL